jgi:hypothetical protein
VIDWVDSAGKTWGRCTRWILTDAGEGYPSADTIERARQGMLSMGDGPPSQHLRKVRLGDAHLVANAMKQSPLMPLPLQAVLRTHCVARASAPLRAKTLGKSLGRREREGMSKAEYWRLLDRSHYFLAARIEPPTQRAGSESRSAEAVRLDAQ